jgi:hypothetical protein
MYIACMRTTVEITAEQRARLLEIAARRGVKGFSLLVQEALDAYLAAQEGGEDRKRRALLSRGSVREGDADKLRSLTHELRKSWR